MLMIWRWTYSWFIAFDLLAWQEGQEKSNKAKKNRPNAGHERTKKGICIENKKQNFMLSRYNESSVKRHIKSVHANLPALVVRMDDIRATDAVISLNELKNEPPKKSTTNEMQKEKWVAIHYRLFSYLTKRAWLDCYFLCTTLKKP